MILVKVVLNDADEFDADTHVIQLLVLEQVDGDLPADVLSILMISVVARTNTVSDRSERKDEIRRAKCASRFRDFQST